MDLLHITLKEACQMIWVVVSNIVYVHPQILGEMIQFDFYFSTGLEPPARDGLQPTFSVSVLFWRNKSSNEN